MPTNPLAQLLLCALGVLVLWVLCGPVLRHLSKPKAPPSLEDIMRADIDHAEREAYRYTLSSDHDAAMAEMYMERADRLITQLAGRTAPDAARITQELRFSDHVHATAAGALNDSTGPEYFDPALVRMRRKDIERTAGAGLDTWGINLGVRGRVGQSDEEYRRELLAAFDVRYPGAA